MIRSIECFSCVTRNDSLRAWPITIWGRDNPLAIISIRPTREEALAVTESCAISLVWVRNILPDSIECSPNIYWPLSNDLPLLITDCWTSNRCRIWLAWLLLRSMPFWFLVCIVYPHPTFHEVGVTVLYLEVVHDRGKARSLAPRDDPPPPVGAPDALAHREFPRGDPRSALRAEAVLRGGLEHLALTPSRTSSRRHTSAGPRTYTRAIFSTVTAAPCSSRDSTRSPSRRDAMGSHPRAVSTRVFAVKQARPLLSVRPLSTAPAALSAAPPACLAASR